MAMICSCRLNGNIGLEEVEIRRLSLDGPAGQPITFTSSEIVLSEEQLVEVRKLVMYINEQNLKRDLIV